MTPEQHQALAPLLHRLGEYVVQGYFDSDDPDWDHLSFAVFLTPDQWLRIKEAFNDGDRLHD